MLRNLRPRKQTSQPFVCWQCLTKVRHNSAQRQKNQRHQGARSLSTVERPKTKQLANKQTLLENWGWLGERAQQPADPSDVRLRLAQWERENKTDFFQVDPLNIDRTKPGHVSNSLTRPSAEAYLDEDPEDVNYGEDGLIEAGNVRKYLLPGDMVELLFMGGQQSELAIFIREKGLQGQYYTMSGRWASRKTTQPTFYVPEFASGAELEAIIPFLPEFEVSTLMEAKIHPFKDALPRNIGKNLMARMDDFWTQADAAYREMASQLENAHVNIAHPRLTSYASLEKIANILLGPANPRDKNCKYSHAVLFAIHRRLMRSDIGLRAQAKGSLRASGEYEIACSPEVTNAYKVAQMVRNHILTIPQGQNLVEESNFNKFISKCQRLIDKSRKYRQFTPHGTIGPLLRPSESDSQYRNGSVQEEFSESDLKVIRFVESWSAHRSFAIWSSLHGIGSAILRATGRYDDVFLDLRTGWTFLQEIGAIPPWEIPQPYMLRLPSIARSTRELPVSQKDILNVDILTHLRKDWGNLPVFCIDDVNAMEIDDGISIEATDTPGEYWVHVHVADPSSHLKPASRTSEVAQRMMQTCYMPDRSWPMLSAPELSLAPNRPCLTFSSRLDANAELLEHKITPGLIRNVIYITPSTLEMVSMDSITPGVLEKANGKASYLVGPEFHSTENPSRKITWIDDLSNEQKDTLKIIRQLGLARCDILKSKGGVLQEHRVFDVSVDFKNERWDRFGWSRGLAGKSLQYHGDPSIKIDIQNSESDIKPLSFLMLLAGEVCAKWCSDRGIPSIYRVTPRNPGKENPTDYFKRVVIPSRDDKGKVPWEVYQRYMELIGPAQPSTVPGPHITIGAEMMTKCTSPLRRYTDLLVHWQIGAALLQEHRLGHSLIGNKDDSIFPFTKAQIDALLPRIDTRERVMNQGEKTARRVWLAQFLLRAWKFGEAKLPSTLTFEVNEVLHFEANGTLREFLAPTQMRIPDWLKVEDVKKSDVFEVNIVDIHVDKGRIFVLPTKRLDTSASAEGETGGRRVML